VKSAKVFHSVQLCQFPEKSHRCGVNVRLKQEKIKFKRFERLLMDVAVDLRDKMDR
jgi:hypothetical protein